MRPEGRLRILFFFGRPNYLRPYAPLVSELARRGHSVHLAFRGRLEEGERSLVETVAASAGVSFGTAPHRGESDGWRPVSWLVRALADLARYSHPRYERAPALRQRMTNDVF